jgi:hypothetical protein
VAHTMSLPHKPFHLDSEPDVVSIRLTPLIPYTVSVVYKPSLCNFGSIFCLTWDHSTKNIRAPFTNFHEIVCCVVNAFNKVVLIKLLTEIIRIILGALADVDLRSLFTFRQTCKAFQAVVTDILNQTSADHGLAIHAVLILHFLPVLESRARSTRLAVAAVLCCAYRLGYTVTLIAAISTCQLLNCLWMEMNTRGPIGGAYHF